MSFHKEILPGWNITHTERIVLKLYKDYTGISVISAWQDQNQEFLNPELYNYSHGNTFSFEQFSSWSIQHLEC